MSATAEGAHTAASAEPNPRRWIALAVIAISQLMVVLDATIVNIALPSAQSDLHISNANRQWVVTAYTLAFGGLLLFGGRIADYWGRKRTFLVGAAGFAAASAIGGLAQNGLMLFAARALQGVFGALLAPASLALLTVLFVEARERARAFAVYGAIAGGGSAVGLLLGGVLTEYANWRWCLLVNIPVAAVALALAIPLVPESKAQGDTSYDVGGAVVVTLGLASLVYGFTKAASDGWGADRDDRLHHGRGGAAGHLRADRTEEPQPAAAAAGRAGPQPRRRLPDLDAGRRRAVRLVPVPHHLPAERACTTRR